MAASVAYMAASATCTADSERCTAASVASSGWPGTTGWQ